MSDHLLRLVPANPTFVPASAAQHAAVARLRAAFPAADHVEVRDHGEVVFVDAGSNVSSVHCPLCRASIDHDWWSAAMDRAHESAFSDRSVIMPCCAARSTLDALDYDGPQAFARFVLEIRNPGVAALPDHLDVELERILGCAVRAIWTRY